MSVGRLAPTPSGALHLGNALAFGAAWISVRNAGGKLLLRMEDLDRGRAREEVAQGQREDLRWLGLHWDEEVLCQSQRSYSLDGIPTWRCDCSRAQRLAGACRCRDRRPAQGNWRFDPPPGEVLFEDRAWGPQRVLPPDGPVLKRADGEAAYPLAVVVDDHRDGVTEVVRGADLLEATALQILLYRSLGWEPPTWLHVPLLVGPDGKKLSKSEGSMGIRQLREAGWSAERVWALLLPLIGCEGPLEQARLEPGPHWQQSWAVEESLEGPLLRPLGPIFGLDRKTSLPQPPPTDSIVRF
jgi:glutamyl/glutaminyl-tRNA synthetase